MDLSPITGAPVLGAEPPRATRAVAASALEQPKSVARDPERVAQAVAAINRALAAHSRGVEFSVDPDTHQTVVRILDLQTKEVIRQMPSEDALAIARSIESVQGVILRQKA